MKTTTMLLIGGAAAVGLYFLWPKIKDNFSFNTTKAYPVPGNPAPDIIHGHAFGRTGNMADFPGQGNAYGIYKRYDPNLGHGPHLA